MSRFALLELLRGVCLFTAVVCGTSMAAQDGKDTSKSKEAASAPKFKTMYSLENELHAPSHRKSNWFKKDFAGNTRAHLNLDVIAPKIVNKMVTEQIAKIHESLRALQVEAEIVWHYTEDAKHDNKHVRVSKDEHVRVLIEAHPGHPESKLSVYVVELDVDIDGDGASEPAVGVRYPDPEGKTGKIEAVLIDDEAFAGHDNALAHAIGHFFGLVGANRGASTHDFRQDGARIGCKSCLKSVGASAAP